MQTPEQDPGLQDRFDAVLGERADQGRATRSCPSMQSVSSHHLSELPGLASDHAKGAFDLEGTSRTLTETECRM